MMIVVALDDRDGMAFNGRRQSRDRLLCEDLVRTAGKNRVYMSPYSAPIFDGIANKNICAIPDFALQAGESDLCLFERELPGKYAARATGLLIYRWNRHYPSDLRSDLDMSEWRLYSREEFAGSSHEKITKEMYVK